MQAYKQSIAFYRMNKRKWADDGKHWVVVHRCRIVGEGPSYILAVRDARPSLHFGDLIEAVVENVRAEGDSYSFGINVNIKPSSKSFSRTTSNGANAPDSPFYKSMLL